MRKIILLLLLLYSGQLLAQHSYGTYYVAAKAGLSMRETPDAAAKVIVNIPYGTRVTTLDDEEEWKSIDTEGLTGYWKKVKYNNRFGYIIDSYLFPWPPPKAPAVKDMRQYLAQVAIPFGQKLIVKSGTMKQLNEGGWEINKQLYKNGAEHHFFMGYEYGSDTYFLPDFSLQQGFLLLRLLPEFKEVFGEKDEFPTTGKKITKGEREYEIKLIKNGEDTEYTGPFTIDRIIISYEDGAYYELHMYLHENQLIIFYSSGV